ncbi:MULTISPECIES: MOSC domain-containing protein [Methylomonas]|uniref:Molybdenum cofactor biosysynthesis protein n=2 Tax=Methylomonas TaxID=416 RepID=A0A126T2Z2_9GAMM|nr:MULTISPECIES: MOSC domain-containing protein [Methylomonas]AMK76432.1 molybdenum cofactor biosysynthesis protein [Methylomonas denitrificans]OAH98691.1 molybdenum cofactor biosysynthesis protein [Methylomonas methanica]TCV88466.1 MOSC domain-containing protein YiiM [Methylomonas methanica]
MTLRDLSQQFASEGRIEAIILRPAHGEPAVIVDEARAEQGRGLLGDRRANVVRSGRQSSKRELTLFQAEHLPIVADWCGLAELEPSRLRRNLVVSGLNLIGMRSPFPDVMLEWAVGEEVIIQVTGPCDPCSKMAAELGVGSYNALRGHCGMTARILSGGLIRVGDRVRLNAIQHVEGRRLG